MISNERLTDMRESNASFVSDVELAEMAKELMALRRYHSYTFEEDSRPLYTTPPVPALVPIELPSAFTPSVIALGPSPVSGMRLDHTGGWLNKARVIAAIRAAGYEVATVPAEEKK